MTRKPRKRRQAPRPPTKKLTSTKLEETGFEEQVFTDNPELTDAAFGPGKEGGE